MAIQFEGTKKLYEQNIRDDYNPGMLAEHSPAETDHPYAANEEHTELVVPASAEVIRRRNNIIRDRRRRWQATLDPQGVVESGRSGINKKADV